MVTKVTSSATPCQVSLSYFALNAGHFSTLWIAVGYLVQGGLLCAGWGTLYAVQGGPEQGFFSIDFVPPNMASSDVVKRTLSVYLDEVAGPVQFLGWVHFLHQKA